jgi:NAD(P)-dependent dehydrogenase (short-subunit alcohol dehydrogenase family)
LGRKLIEEGIDEIATDSGRSAVEKSKSQTTKGTKMNTKKLAGKVAVVTGASKGIGADIAKHLAAEGATVVNYAASKEGADRVVDEITKQGGKAIAAQADVSKKADIERLFAATKKAFGQLDILVNNAGVYQFAPLEAVTEEEFHRQFNTNVSRSNPRDAGSAQALWRGGRQRDQHRLCRE